MKVNKISRYSILKAYRVMEKPDHHSAYEKIVHGTLVDLEKSFKFVCWEVDNSYLFSSPIYFWCLIISCILYHVLPSSNISFEKLEFFLHSSFLTYIKKFWKPRHSEEVNFPVVSNKSLVRQLFKIHC